MIWHQINCAILVNIHFCIMIVTYHQENILNLISSKILYIIALNSPSHDCHYMEVTPLYHSLSILATRVPFVYHTHTFVVMK